MSACYPFSAHYAKDFGGLRAFFADLFTIKSNLMVYWQTLADILVSMQMHAMHVRNHFVDINDTSPRLLQANKTQGLRWAQKALKLKKFLSFFLILHKMVEESPLFGNVRKIKLQS